MPAVAAAPAVARYALGRPARPTVATVIATRPRQLCRPKQVGLSVRTRGRPGTPLTAGTVDPRRPGVPTVPAIEMGLIAGRTITAVTTESVAATGTAIATDTLNTG